MAQNVSSEDFFSKALEKLMKDIEETIYIGGPSHTRGLRKFLAKLGIKSAYGTVYLGSPLQVESLEATLKSVTFDDKDLKLWNKPTVIPSDQSE